MKAIALMVDDYEVDPNCYHIFQAVKEHSGHPVKVEFRHVLRECNGVADAIAKLGFSMQQEIVFYIKPSVAILPCLEADVSTIGI